MTINVTQEDIDRGERGQCRTCPIAKAVIRELDETDVYVIGPYLVIGIHGPTRLTIDLPDAVTRFVEDFDSEDSVAPFSFELEVPTP